MSSIYDILSTKQIDQLKDSLRKDFEESLENVFKRLVLTKDSEVPREVQSSDKTHGNDADDNIGVDDSDDEEESSNERFLKTNSKKTASVPETATEPIDKKKVMILHKFYTEVSHALYGNTYPHKTILKDEGLKYNGGLSIGAGWLIPVTKADATLAKLKKKGLTFVEEENPKHKAPETKKDTPPKVEPPAKKGTKTLNKKSKSSSEDESEDEKPPKKAEPVKKSKKEDEEPKETKKVVKSAPSPKEKAKVLVKKNSCENMEDKNTGIVFMKTKDGNRAIGTQIKDSKKKGLESVKPLDEETIKICIANGWSYDKSVLQADNSESESDYDSESESD